ncbi:MAG: hypothetical protein IPN17_02455 [Deltaproteobacteria bacterium]|nr:hypothetical protein [Deltaproteobacteria bacterium]
MVLTVRREGASGPLRSARTTALGVGGERRALPLLVGVTAGIDLRTPVWIEALGCGDPNGCTAATAVVTQRAVVRFTRGETQEVTLLLASACVGVACASDQRCAVDSGRCEAATRAQEMVRPFSGTDAATVSGDAKVADGSTDADTLTDSALDIGGDDAVVADASHDVAALKDAVVRVDVEGDDASELDAGVIDLPDVGGLADVPVWDEDLGERPMSMLLATLAHPHSTQALSIQGRLA